MGTVILSTLGRSAPRYGAAYDGMCRVVLDLCFPGAPEAEFFYAPNLLPYRLCLPHHVSGDTKNAAKQPRDIA